MTKCRTDKWVFLIIDKISGNLALHKTHKDLVAQQATTSGNPNPFAPDPFYQSQFQQFIDLFSIYITHRLSKSCLEFLFAYTLLCETQSRHHEFRHVILEGLFVLIDCCRG